MVKAIPENCLLKPEYLVFMVFQVFTSAFAEDFGCIRSDHPAKEVSTDPARSGHSFPATSGVRLRAAFLLVAPEPGRSAMRQGLISDHTG
jgi:hypothetical protein